MGKKGKFRPRDPMWCYRGRWRERTPGVLARIEDTRGRHIYIGWAVSHWNVSPLPKRQSNVK